MGFIQDSINKPGPGVEKDAPPKKGVARFWEIFTRDYLDIIKANLFTLLIFIPSLTFVVLYFMGEVRSLWFLIFAWLLAIPASPALCAQVSVTTQMLRDIPGFIWRDYKRAYKSCFKQGSIFFAIWFPLAAILSYAIYNGIFSETGANLLLLCCFIIALITLVSVLIFTVSQIAMLRLPLGTMFKNSLILTIGRAGRALIGILLLLLTAAVIILFLPYSGILVLFGFPGFMLLVILMVVWPALGLIMSAETPQNDDSDETDDAISDGDFTETNDHTDENTITDDYSEISYNEISDSTDKE